MFQALGRITALRLKALDGKNRNTIWERFYIFGKSIILECFVILVGHTPEGEGRESIFFHTQENLCCHSEENKSLE